MSLTQFEQISQPVQTTSSASFSYSTFIYICPLRVVCFVHRIFCVVRVDRAFCVGFVARVVSFVLAILKVHAVHFNFAVCKGRDICIELGFNSVCNIYAVRAVCTVRLSYEVLVVMILQKRVIVFCTFRAVRVVHVVCGSTSKCYPNPFIFQ